MKVFLTGAHSSGKTTLAKILADLLGWQMLPEVARDVLKTHGLTYPLPDYLVNLIQSEIARRQVEILRTSKPDYVSDRFLDCFAYWIVHGDQNLDNRFSLGWASISCLVKSDFFADAKIFVLPPRKELLVTDEIRCVADWETCLRLDAVNKAVLAAFNLRWHEVTALSVEDRVKEVLSVCGIKT